MKQIIYHVSRFIAAFILLQTLYFKFTASEESVFIFSSLGVEPWGRILSGILELVASVLLIYPALAWLGALFSLGIMFGAISAHIFIMGIVIMNDSGLLFGLAVFVFLLSLYVLFHDRKKIPYIKTYFKA
ncbi:MAG: DoxX family protein [Leptospira sp.]|nr:DoxX family protein [Leptospira sp.]